MKIVYVEKRFAPATVEVIEQAIEILEQFEQDGFDLSLRQLYYQFVARGLIENTDREYNRLGGIVNDARLAGLIDWDHIVDRTRTLRRTQTWPNPRSIVQACAEQFTIDMWATQPIRVEVWVEKDALVDVVGQACRPHDVPFFSCRGYTSQSSIYKAAGRISNHIASSGQAVEIIHLGDHDPSGIDMTRDITDRLRMMVNENLRSMGVTRSRTKPNHPFRVNRIALTMKQIKKHKPPPNPAKMTDSRFASYEDKYGDESWELDALDPHEIVGLIDKQILSHIDGEAWIESECKRDEGRAQIQRLAEEL